MRPLFMQTLIGVLITGLVLAITGSGLFAVALLTGAAPTFDQQIMLDDRHILAIHNGPRPTCSFIPNPPQHDCFSPGSGRREFSVDYLTPYGAQSLIWFQLSEQTHIAEIATPGLSMLQEPATDHHTDCRKEQTMKRRLYWFSVLTALLAALTLSGPALAAGTQVPFKGRSSGVVKAVGFDPVAGIAFTHVEGEGQATHLGRFTVSADVAVDVATGIPQGTWTLTAINGDKLVLAMGGHGIDQTHGFGAFTVVGGTGRFGRATGYYEQIITFAVPLGTSDSIPYTDILKGTISFGHQ